MLKQIKMNKRIKSMAHRQALTKRVIYSNLEESRKSWAQHPDNLNKVWPSCENPSDFIKMFDNSLVKKGVAVYFRDLEDHLVRHIEESDSVLGCVAWLTSRPILEALAKKRHVNIIVQKEDFLRPGGWGDPGKQYLRDLYKKLPEGGTRCGFGDYGWNLGLYLSHGSSQEGVESIRCVGNHNSTKSPSHPRMHNKFMIFSKKSKGKSDCVWTGSFNFTWNAGRSLENAVCLEDLQVIAAYYREFCQILAISEPLNWDSEWCSPEWRLGS